MPRQEPARRGSVVIVVLWAISLAAVITTSVQLFGYRQATLGREAEARVQARWAARAGVEYTIAVMASHTQKPVADHAFAMVRDMEYVYIGDLHRASYDIRHHSEGKTWRGPMDEHSKFNLANNDRGMILNLLEDMSIDILVAIEDWIDADDNVGSLGAERDWYLSRESPYEPRNGPLRSVAELELVAGIWPQYLRGEDWNLNGRLDPNEDDGPRSWPLDEPDEYLDAGWSAFLTTHSVRGGATASGLPRIDLGDTDVDELEDRLDVDEAQAEALMRMAGTAGSGLEVLLTVPLATFGQRQPGSSVEALTSQQITAIFAETSRSDPRRRLPGKMNINTIPAELLRDLVVELGAEEVIADEILFLRESRPEGIVSITELEEIPDLDPALWQRLAELMDTSSNVYTISSKGRSWSTGAEVEIIAVVDRSTLPVRILEYREP